jgi:predicted Zn-dependent protease
MMLTLKQQIQALIDKRAFTKAIGVASEYVRRHPECSLGYQLTAMAEEAAGYTKAAIQTIGRAIELAPEDASLRIVRARLLLKDKRLQAAIAEVDTIIAQGNSYQDAELLQEAVACKNELLERMAASHAEPKPLKTSRPCMQSLSGSGQTSANR